MQVVEDEENMEGADIPSTSSQTQPCKNTTRNPVAAKKTSKKSKAKGAKKGTAKGRDKGIFMLMFTLIYILKLTFLIYNSDQIFGTLQNGNVCEPKYSLNNTQGGPSFLFITFYLFFKKKQILYYILIRPGSQSAKYFKLIQPNFL